MSSDSSLTRKPAIHCLGASHKSAPQTFRETIFLSSEQLENLLVPLKNKHQFDELMILSTCNRLDMYALSLSGQHNEESLRRAYHDLQVLAGKTVTPSHEEMSRCTYYFHDLHCIEHIFAVACSLDSLVVGETQITGQFKDALSLAGRVEAIGPYLDRLAQEVLATAKKVRTQTRIGEKTVSISHAAIDLAKRVFRHIGDHSFLFIGAGEMGEVAARYARNYNPQTIYVVNRTLERARALVENLGVGQAFGMDRLEELLEEVDIVVSSTASLHPIITYPMLKQVMRRRRGRPLFLVDIAIPRDIDAQCSQLSDVYLFEIDDLQKVVADNLEERRQSADEARAYVKKGAEQFSRWLANVAVKPILANFREYLNDLVSREVSRTLNREIYKDLSEQQLKGLKHMLQSIAGKIVSDAARAIHNPEEALREQLASSLRVMFSRLPSDSRDLEKKEEEADDPCPNNIINL